MAQNSKLARRIKSQMEKFADQLSEGLGKPTGRLVREMIYGIQCSKDVKLSNISRALREDIRLIKTTNRLSRNLSSRDLSDVLNRRLSWAGSRRVKKDTVLALDLSDLTKKYAKKLSDGYWLCDVLGADGIHRILFGSSGPLHPLDSPSNPNQQRFAFDLPPS